MPFLVTDSTTPLPVETLPALKLTHYYENPVYGQIYAYLRCYVHKGAFCYNLLVFEEAPPASRRIGFALCPAQSQGQFLFASFAKPAGTDALALCDIREDGQAVASCHVPLPPARRSAGEDEQGPYWCAEGVLPASIFLEAFGKAPHAGEFWPSNVFLYDTAAPGFGAAFPCRNMGGVWQAGLEPFMVVPY